MRLLRLECGARFRGRCPRHRVAWCLLWCALVATTRLAQATETSPTPRIGDAWADSNNPIVRIFKGQRLDLWSLRPLSHPTPPAPRDLSPERVRNPIDRFIQSRLEAEGWHPWPEADRRTLARRVSFDLVGLPPSPEAIDRFLSDPAPDAYERFVDALLASHAYGEHQARHWMDVVRYSDSNGFDWDEFRPHAWRYRDYVVRSFNANKPFDQFIQEQIAGDERLAGPPTSAAEQDMLIATGYLRLGPQDNSAPLFNEQTRARAEWLADLTETTGSAFLGLTLSCCRCHDHKFDPLSQADHFRIRAFFEPIQRGDSLALDLAEQQEAIRAQHQRVQGVIAPLDADRIQRLQQAKAKTAKPGQTTPVSDADAIKTFSTDEKAKYDEIVKRIEELEKTKLPWTRGLLATDSQEPVPPTRILFQGDHKAERAAVTPGFLSILDPNPAKLKPPASTNTTGRRLTLAQWIGSPDNPLTARVFVNRAWQSVFGRGLVTTPNDFGLAGARPSHPELLDWLAGEFLRNGWAPKNLHRLLVTSAAYRRSSSRGTKVPVRAPEPGDLQPGSADSADSENVLLGRQNLRRLTAEQLRDAILIVGGLLRHRVGGPPIWPELPADVLQANPAFLDDNPEKTKGWYPTAGDERWARSLYLVQKRTVKVPFLETFDLPDNSTSCPRRTESIVAPQALTLLNGSEATEAARGFAARVIALADPSPSSRIHTAFRLALQRPPTDTEHARSEAFLAESSLPEFCRALLSLNEFAFLD